MGPLAVAGDRGASTTCCRTSAPAAAAPMPALPAVAWPPPRRAAIRHAPPRRHRHVRYRAPVGIGLLAAAGDRGAVHQFAAAHKALGDRNRGSGDVRRGRRGSGSSATAKRARRADRRSRPAVAGPPPTARQGGTQRPERHDWFDLAAGGGAGSSSRARATRALSGSSS
jgi:hypothetical protein